MKRAEIALLSASVIVSAALFASCSKETQPQEAPTPSRPSAQSATPAAQAAQPEPGDAATAPGETAAEESAQKPAGNKATEKHALALSNYSGVAVTVSLNGEWVGQWDAHANAPLDSVVRGKNDLVVELQDEPKNSVTIEVNAVRGGGNVNLLRLNFQGKKAGKYTYNFVAR